MTLDEFHRLEAAKMTAPLLVEGVAEAYGQLTPSEIDELPEPLWSVLIDCVEEHRLWQELRANDHDAPCTHERIELPAEEDEYGHRLQTPGRVRCPDCGESVTFTRRGS